MQQNPLLRNIAIIAHVDHGKTTLVDQLFKQSGLFRESQVVEDRIMDSMDLERERGITISAKNCSVFYKDIKINIVDTPGHADFGGEVERALKMVDGVILLVDAAEGPLPQTRFVLQKALQQDKRIIVVLNKIDRKDARPEEVLNEIYDLFIDLDASEEQIEFPILYAIGRDGIAQKTLEEKGVTLEPLFEQIIKTIPGPSYDENSPFQMLVCNVGYSDYTGRLAIGRVFNGSAKKNDNLVCLKENNKIVNLKISKLQVYDGVSLKDVDEVSSGEIIILSGVEDVHIGDTIANKTQPIALPRLEVDEPTVAMAFFPNNSPLAGKEGKYVQSRRIFDRLKKETLFNVAIEVEASENQDSFLVKGRGEFQMAVLVETMRREDYELCVGRPQIIFKQGENNEKLEPIEHLILECEKDFQGIVTEKLSQRKGQMTNMHPFSSNRVRLEFTIPSRGLIGYRSEFLTDTKGTGIMNTYLKGYEPYKGEIQSRKNGSLVSDRSGNAIPYALFSLEDRGRLFVLPGVPVYEGMIIGEYNREQDLNVNPTREKKLTNMRASGKDEHVTLTPITPLTLEQAIEFIKDDELVEVTPKSIRLRKVILSSSQREIAKKHQKKN